MRISRTLVAAALALGALAVAQAPDTFSLRRVPTKGETLTFKFESRVSMYGIPVEFAATLRQTVTEVNPDGSFVVESFQTEGKASFEIAGPQGPKKAEQVLRDQGPTTTTYARDNVVTKIEAEGLDANAYRRAAITTLAVRRDAYRVGESWSVVLAGDVALGMVDTTLEYRVEAIEEQLGVQCARVHLSAKENAGSFPMTAEGKLWVSLTDGALVKSDLQHTNLPVGEQRGNPQVVISRVASP